MPNRPTVRSTPWPVSPTPVPPPVPAAVPAAPPAAPAAAMRAALPDAPPPAPEVQQPRRPDRLVRGLVLLAVVLLALAAGLGAAALVEHRAHPSDRDAWLAGVLAAAVVLALGGVIPLLRRPGRS